MMTTNAFVIRDNVFSHGAPQTDAQRFYYKVGDEEWARLNTPKHELTGFTYREFRGALAAMFLDGMPPALRGKDHDKLSRDRLLAIFFARRTPEGYETLGFNLFSGEDIDALLAACKGRVYAHGKFNYFLGVLVNQTREAGMHELADSIVVPYRMVKLPGSGQMALAFDVVEPHGTKSSRATH